MNEIPQPTTMEDIQALLRREDMTATRVVAIELPREPHDGDPRCAIMFAGPEAYAALNLMIQVLEATSQQLNSKQVVESGRMN